MKLLSQLDVSAKRVFLRADLDVNVGQFTEATRLQSVKPTVEYLLAHGTKQIIIAGHIDRPEGPDPTLSTQKLEEPLEEILKRSVTFKPDFFSDGALASMAQLVLFENLRFWPGEAADDLEFAKRLANLADVYVNEAFGNCHRSHASMVALPALLPHAAGLHLEREVDQLTKLIKDAERPFIAIIGGAKIETKVPVIENLAKFADTVLVGGELPIEIERNGARFGDNVKIAELEANKKDIKEGDARDFAKKIKEATTVVWNGPMGVFEQGYEAGTMIVAEAILASGAYSVVGGRETTQFLASKGLLSRFAFVSSGGGAMLEFLAGHELPGIKALE